MFDSQRNVHECNVIFVLRTKYRIIKRIKVIKKVQFRFYLLDVCNLTTTTNTGVLYITHTTANASNVCD